jgi:hypothetical protein
MAILRNVRTHPLYLVRRFRAPPAPPLVLTLYSCLRRPKITYNYSRGGIVPDLRKQQLEYKGVQIKVIRIPLQKVGQFIIIASIFF